MSQLTYYLQIIEQADFDAIESARGSISDDDLGQLIEQYWRMESWSHRTDLVNLIQDMYHPTIKAMMLDYLRVPVVAGDEYTELAQAVALSFVDEAYDQFMVYYNDREQLRHDVTACLQAHNLTAEPPPAVIPTTEPPPPTYHGSPDERLLKAAQAGDMNQVAQALQDGADINCRVAEGIYEGCTPLLMAFIERQFDMVHYLLDHGADVTLRRAKSGQSALEWAVFTSQLDLVKRIMGLGVDVNEPNNYDSTPLQNAATQKDVSIVTYLLEVGADIHVKGSYGRKAIHVAVEQGYTKIVKALLEAGNDADEPYNGQTLLMSAIQNGHQAIARLLIKQGATIDFRCERQYMRGLTPLMVAAKQGYAKIVKLLVEAGASVNLVVDAEIENYRERYAGYTAFDFATGKRAEEIQAILIAAGGVSGLKSK